MNTFLMTHNLNRTSKLPGDQKRIELQINHKIMMNIIIAMKKKITQTNTLCLILIPISHCTLCLKTTEKRQSRFSKI